MNETFTTKPITFEPSTSDFHDFVLDVQQALVELPNNVIDKVDVHGEYGTGTSSGAIQFSANTGSGYQTNQWIVLNFSFTGNNVQGPQNMLTVRDYLCGDGCTPKITGVYLQPFNQNVTTIQLADFNSYECGRRGKCDYTTGICNCFAGYTGLACNTITALV